MSKKEAESLTDHPTPTANTKNQRDYVHFRNFQKDLSLNRKIDEILHSTNNLNEIESKVTTALTREVSRVQANQGSNQEVDVPKLVGDVVKHKMSAADLSQEPIEQKNTEQSKYITNKSKENLKMILRNAVVYEIYKVMNPRRIAGETAKDNYMHNMLVGGEKLAGKHTGGRPREVAKYSQKDKQVAQQIANSWQRPGAFKPASKSEEGWVRKK